MKREFYMIEEAGKLFTLEARETWFDEDNQLRMKTNYIGTFISVDAAYEWIVAHPRVLEAEEKYWAVMETRLNKPAASDGEIYFFTQAGENMIYQPNYRGSIGMKYEHKR